jgi:hypothetical protein
MMALNTRTNSSWVKRRKVPHPRLRLWATSGGHLWLCTVYCERPRRNAECPFCGFAWRNVVPDAPSGTHVCSPLRRDGLLLLIWSLAAPQSLHVAVLPPGCVAAPGNARPLCRHAACGAAAGATERKVGAAGAPQHTYLLSGTLGREQVRQGPWGPEEWSGLAWDPPSRVAASRCAARVQPHRSRGAGYGVYGTCQSASPDSPVSAALFYRRRR